MLGSFRSGARLLAALLALAFAQVALAQTFPPLSGRVVDAANILTPDQVQQLTQLSTATEQASTRQLVIATVPDLQGYAIEDYGYKLLRAWGIGQAKVNNGVILLIAPNERKVRIEVGYGLEPILTDAYSNQIIQQQIIPRFKAGDMGGGVVAGATAIAEQLKAPQEAAEARAAQAATTRHRKGNGNDGFGVLVFFVVMFLFVILPMIRRARGKRYRGHGGWPIILWGPNLGGNDSWSSGGGSSWSGGWGGGDSGGGFSGGGGSSGGGGASGSW